MSGGDLEFDTLNKELIPLIDQYKNLQRVYLEAINDGGCFITIKGNCEHDKIRTDHPYFLENLSGDDNSGECRKKQRDWQKRCNNNDVKSIFLKKGSDDIIDKTETIRNQLNTLSKLIIDKFNQLQTIVEKTENVNPYDKEAATKHILGNIKTLLDEKDKMIKIKPANFGSSKKKLDSTYLKYIFWVCLVVLLICVIYVISVNSDNLLILIIKLVVVMISLYYAYSNLRIFYIVIFIIVILAIFFNI